MPPYNPAALRFYLPESTRNQQEPWAGRERLVRVNQPLPTPLTAELSLNLHYSPVWRQPNYTDNLWAKVRLFTVWTKNNMSDRLVGQDGRPATRCIPPTRDFGVSGNGQHRLQFAFRDIRINRSGDYYFEIALYYGNPDSPGSQAREIAPRVKSLSFRCCL